jgi:hypothetical protein
MAKTIKNRIEKTPLQKAESQIKYCARFAYLSAAATAVFCLDAILGRRSALSRFIVR